MEDTRRFWTSLSCCRWRRPIRSGGIQRIALPAHPRATWRPQIEGDWHHSAAPEWDKEVKKLEIWESSARLKSISEGESEAVHKISNDLCSRAWNSARSFRINLRLWLLATVSMQLSSVRSTQNLNPIITDANHNAFVLCFSRLMARTCCMTQLLPTVITAADTIIDWKSQLIPQVKLAF